MQWIQLKMAYALLGQRSHTWPEYQWGLGIRCIILQMQEYSFDSQVNSLFGSVWPENCFMKKSEVTSGLSGK